MVASPAEGFYKTAASMRALVFCKQTWRQLRVTFADHYRPEQHYMRGPGPKWRATRRANPGAH
jgi:hypothetical protein